MSLDPISAGLELANTIVKTIWPDESAQDAAKIELLKTQIATQAALLIEQAKTNQVEASSDNVFVAGWRPSVGWVCSLALAWTFLVSPVLQFFLPGRPVPTVPSDMLFELVLALLGVAGLRSVEKFKGIAR